MNTLKVDNLRGYDYIHACKRVASTINNEKLKTIPTAFLEKGMYNILGINDIIYDLVLSIESKLKKSNLFRFKSKKLITEIKKNVTDFNKYVWGHFDHYDKTINETLAEYTDRFREVTEESYNGYRDAIRSVIATNIDIHVDIVTDIVMLGEMIHFAKETRNAYSTRAKNDYGLSEFKMFDVVTMEMNLGKKTEELLASINTIKNVIKINETDIAKPYNLFMKTAVSNDATINALNDAIEKTKIMINDSETMSFENNGCES